MFADWILFFFFLCLSLNNRLSMQMYQIGICWKLYGA